MTENTCYYCKEEFDAEDLRPYGPKCALVCFACAMATPEREKETEKNLEAQFEAAGELRVIGSGAGPFPLKNLGDIKIIEGEQEYLELPGLPKIPILGVANCSRQSLPEAEETAKRIKKWIEENS